MEATHAHSNKSIRIVSIPEDIKRFHELGVLDWLLFDHTTGKNILWATDAYSRLGDGFEPKGTITSEKIIGTNAENIRRRSVKNKEEQDALTRTHAEVFTPARIVKFMVDEADVAWSESERRQKRSDGWQKYVASPRLEITCGEAPFLVNRYDAADGSVTPLDKRAGILSRKLALVNENTKTRATWLKWARTALQSIYGYEFQGDNLLIARVNVLCTMEDYLEAAGYKPFTKEEYSHFAEIISWNLWQMDGLTNCVPFGIAKKDAVQKSLFDSIDVPDEIEYYGDCVIFDWKNGRTVEFASIRKGSDMKFDYIIGNPPYQEETETNGRQPPIYDKFMDGAYKAGNVVELITPARFLFNAGQTPKAWNRKMLNDEHLKVVAYWQDGSLVFPTTDIKGGVAVTLRNESRCYGKIGVFTSFDELNSILAKTKPSSSLSNLSEVISSRGLYRLSKQFFEDYPSAADRMGNGTGNMLVSNIFAKIPEAFHEIKEDQDILLYGRIDNHRTERFLPRKYIIPNNYLESFNVLIPKSSGSGKFGESLSQPFIAKPEEGALDSFISIGKYHTEESAKYLLKYLKTKFLRTLLGAKKVTQDNPKSVWILIPLQDFTSSSDIDWSQSVAEIDVQLYKKYGLSPEEIDFIETHVKAMD